MTNHIDRIRAHVEAHKDRERATFSIEGIKALLSQIDSALPGPAARTKLVQELQWYAEKKRWPKGLAPLGDLLKQAIAALSAAEPWPFERQNYNCPCIHPSQCDESCVKKPAPSLAVKVLRDAAHDAAVALNAVLEKPEDKDRQHHARHYLATLQDALSAQTQGVAGLTNEQKEVVLLLILDAMGGKSDASESKHSWVNWFCSDEIPNVQSDTLNRCMEKGWLRYSHNTDTDHGMIYLSPLGRMRVAQLRAALSAAPAKLEAVKPCDLCEPHMGIGDKCSVCGAVQFAAAKQEGT